ncbi:hypothetical protein KSP39_PZI008985 [Platanthera zijinensis]|uniref:Reverse transcriptase Ty1/copia-type domain-containing protein n=1 Tax=Platanthera zijinensis TaxID=2320716 RepID=A0AAP0BME3_9ASPA
MDVTFREGKSYFPSSTHVFRQGESSSTTDDVTAVPLPLLLSSSSIPSPPFTQVPRAPPIPIPDSSTTISLFPHVYHRHSGTQVTTAPPLPVPTSDSDSDDADLHMPLASLKKGKTTFTQHPISNHAAYHHLTTSHQTFVSSLSLVIIPKTCQEALGILVWTQAMRDEMSALDKNHTWDISAPPSGKKAIACLDWELHQLDVKITFLHGELEEEVYMKFPPGFVKKGAEGFVCHLRKSLYGLKQSPRAWFGRFLTTMLKFGYKQDQSDHTMFIRRHEQHVVVLIVYVDDIVITGNDTEEIANLKTLLSTEFEVKDLGRLRYFLCIEVVRCERGVFISQRKYILDLLKETCKLGCVPTNTPMEENHRIDEDGDGDHADVSRYQRLVEKLIYLSHTRPDITKSTTGYCSFVGDNLVTWRSKKQNVVARSSAEAEYRGMSQGLSGRCVHQSLGCEVFTDDIQKLGMTDIFLLRTIGHLKLHGTKSKEDFVMKIEAAVKDKILGEWVFGGGWNNDIWGGELPAASWIDDITSDNPVCLTRMDGHMSLVNSLALKIAGITNSSLDPFGGKIYKTINGAGLHLADCSLKLPELLCANISSETAQVPDLFSPSISMWASLLRPPRLPLLCANISFETVQSPVVPSLCCLFSAITQTMRCIYSARPSY